MARRHHTFRLIAGIVAVVGLAGAGRAAGPSLAISLAPQPVSPGGKAIGTIAVALRFSSAIGKAGTTLLRLPLVVSNVDTVAATVGVEAHDDHGPLRLTIRDVDVPVAAIQDAEAGGRSREWYADRPVRGTLIVRYVIPARATRPPRGPAPPFSFSDDGEATSAAGQTFLLLPPGLDRYQASISWDLTALPRGARAVSSFGVGDVAPPGRLSAMDLRAAFYMAGKIGSWPTGVPARGFFSAWQGAPPFDADALMRWTAALHARYAAFFGQTTPQPYGVFLRYNPVNAGGGVGLRNSFVATFGRAGGPGSDADQLRFTLAHEMFHTFQPFIADPPGLASSWFGEGLATFYQRRLPLRFGMISPDAFLRDLNFHAGRYYSSALADTSNDEVPKRFWADTRIRTLPYDRGLFYFATVDDAVRKHSGGARSMDDLMLAMLAREEQGHVLTPADWEETVGRELGPKAIAEFRAFLTGRPPLPPSDAFGPCFQRVAVRLRRYEIGFDPAVLAEPKRIVRGLVAGSAAAVAGIRDGDEIVDPVPQDDIQGRQTQMLGLMIRRGGRTWPVRYLPRGETVDAWQWARVDDVPDDRCAL